MTQKKILGFGQVLWDLSVFIDFQFLKDIDISVGGHRNVPKETLDEILEKIKTENPNNKIIKNSGGSCANVMSNLAKLGTQSAFCGKHGQDEDGRLYMEILANEGVKPYSVIDKENATGQLLSLITPDKDRTFIVHWGASELLPPESIDQKLVKQTDYVHMEGYLIINSAEALWVIFENAQKTTFDLAAHSVVEQTKPELQKMMKKYPPKIIFSNEFEGVTFTHQKDHHKIVDELLNFCDIAVLTLGEKGVLVKTSTGEEHFEPAFPTNLVDTTGAGDSFCAGFLHEFLKNESIEKAAKLGVRVASITISQIGARSFQVVQLK